MDDSEVRSRLTAAYARQGQSVDIKDMQLLTGGSAAQTWRYTCQIDGDDKVQILRMSHPGERFALGLDKVSEARAQNIAFTHGVLAAPVPLILLPEDGLGEGFVMPFIKGEAIPQKILRDEQFAAARESLTEDCARELSAIHKVSPDELGFLPSLPAQTQLDRLMAYYSDFGEIIPIFDYTFRWLSRNAPEPKRQTLVHGDFRMGNLLVNQHGLACVMDWELCHIGDPLEDLGWLCVPSWRFGNLDKAVGGFGGYEALLSDYQARSGQSVSAPELRYWIIFGVLKWGIICLYQTDVHLRGEERSINRAAIGRRVSETELDLIALFEEV